MQLLNLKLALVVILAFDIAFVPGAPILEHLLFRDFQLNRVPMMNRRQHSLRLLIICLLALATAWCQAREWSYRGNVVEGELERVTDDIVVVKSTSGSTIIISRSDLSRADETYVKDWKRNGGKPPGAGPRESTSSKPSGTDEGDDVAPWDSRPSAPEAESEPPPSRPNQPTGDLPDDLRDIKAGQAYEEPDDGPSPLENYLTSLPGLEKAGDRASHIAIVIAGAVIIWFIAVLIMALVLMWACRLVRIPDPPGLATTFGVLLLAGLLQAVLRWALSMTQLDPVAQAAFSLVLGIFVLWGLVVMMCGTRPVQGCLVLLVWVLLATAVSFLLAGVIFGVIVLLRIAGFTF